MIFDHAWKAQTVNAESSYQKNNLGDFLYGLVRGIKPKVAVEFGVLNGYSTLHIAAGLRDSGEDSKLYAYDRWPAHIPSCEQNVRDRILRAELSVWVDLETRDVFRDPPPFVDGSIDFLHVDLENTYRTLSWAFDKYAIKMAPWGVMAFEGGTKERDALEWVERHDSRGGIRGFVSDLMMANSPQIPNYTYFIVPAFPGITVIQPRWDGWA